MDRKRICLLTIFPEAEYQQRVLSGIFSQAAKYDYDVVVFSPLIQVCNVNKRYVHGENNIFKLINFDIFDGVIITPVPMYEDQNTDLLETLLNLLKKKCSKPVVSIDMAFGDYPVVYTDDETPFFHITQHLIKKHKCKTFSVLGGSEEDYTESPRIRGIIKALEKNNLTLNSKSIYPGDYWYTSGESLGKKYIAGELELPDAVICLSDHMAIGLTNILNANGIKVPQQVIVTGYEAVQEASLNNPPITSYLSEQQITGQNAVNFLHHLWNPKKVVIPSDKVSETGLCIGGTCGCREDLLYTRERLKNNQINLKFDFSDFTEDKKTTMGMFLESYMVERLAEAISPSDVLSRIYEVKYLIKPYEHFYICMNENWLDDKCDNMSGYPDTMMLTLSADKNPKEHGVRYHVFFGNGREKPFSTSEMLPALYQEYSKAQVFYFVPIHFGTTSLGYAVLQNNLSEPGIIGSVFRNFMRNVNNALEMTRAKYQISYLSEHDTMTGLYNRRGMERAVRELEAKSTDESVWFVIVIDMDGLKRLNDTFGHTEGDNGIIAVSQAVASITEPNEICVRSGGDEFFIIGLGEYDHNMLREKLDRFKYYLETKNDVLTIPVDASIGYSMALKNGTETFLEVLNKADENMYKNKREKKLRKEKEKQ